MTAEPQAAPSPGFVSGLDGVRAFAFLGVFLMHVGLLKGGYLGVQAFFVLSGFLLTPILLDLARRVPRGDYFRIFYGRRALRILPLYFSYLLLAALVAPLIAAHATVPTDGVVRDFFDQLPWTATFTFDFFHASRYYVVTPLTTHFWSLAVEEQFYLVWPIAILAAARKGPRTLLLALICIGPLIRALIAWAALGGQLLLINRDLSLALYVLPFSYVDAFAAGGYFALYGRSWGALRVSLALVLVVAAGLTLQFLLGEGGGASTLGYPFPMRGALREIWGPTVFNLVFGALMLEVRNGRFAQGVLAHPVTRYCGRISYGLYVYHLPVIWAWYSLAPGTHLAWFALGSLATTIALAVLSFELFERRCLRLKDRWFPSRPIVDARAGLLSPGG